MPLEYLLIGGVIGFSGIVYSAWRGYIAKKRHMNSLCDSLQLNPKELNFIKLRRLRLFSQNFSYYTPFKQLNSCGLDEEVAAAYYNLLNYGGAVKGELLGKVFYADSPGREEDLKVVRAYVTQKD